MLKLFQEFTFEANAEDIFRFIFEAGKMQTCRALTPDYKVTFTHQLRPGVGVTKLHSIIFGGVDICLVKKFDDTQSGVACSIDFLHPAAEIALTQEKVRECKASLYVETDLQRIWPQEADQWWQDAHRKFISIFWRFLIKTWIDHRSADKNSTAIPKPVRALFQLSFDHHPGASIFIGGDSEVLSRTSTFATTPSLFVLRLIDYLDTIPLPHFQASLGRIQLPLGLIQLAYLAELREAPDLLTDTPVKAETFAFRLSKPKIIPEGIISDKTETGKVVVEINAVNCGRIQPADRFQDASERPDPSELSRVITFTVSPLLNGKQISVTAKCIGVAEEVVEYFMKLAEVDEALQKELGVMKCDQELFIEDIDSFAKAQDIKSQDVKSLVPLNISEDQIQTFFEEIIGENFHQHDWGGELNDLVTSQIQVRGKRLRAAFLLKGNGTKGKLTITKCGKNGDQIIRLVEAPVDLYVIQHVDEIDQRVIYDLQTKVQLKNSNGEKCQMCIIDGSETARILKAYGKI